MFLLEVSFCLCSTAHWIGLFIIWKLIFTHSIVINQWGNTWRRLLNCANQHWKSWLSLVIRLLISNTYYISRYCVTYFSQNRVKLNIYTYQMRIAWSISPENASILPILTEWVLHEFNLTQKLFQLTNILTKIRIAWVLSYSKIIPTYRYLPKIINIPTNRQICSNNGQRTSTSVQPWSNRVSLLSLLLFVLSAIILESN